MLQILDFQDNCSKNSKRTDIFNGVHFWIRRVNKKTENHKKLRLATLKRLKRGDENELERYLRLEKVVASKQLRLALETEEQDWRMMQLPNGSGWPWRWTKKEKQNWRRW